MTDRPYDKLLQRRLAAGGMSNDAAVEVARQLYSSTSGGLTWLTGGGPPGGVPQTIAPDGVNDPWVWSPTWRAWARAWHITWSAGAVIDGRGIPDLVSMRYNFGSEWAAFTTTDYPVDPLVSLKEDCYVNAEYRNPNGDGWTWVGSDPQSPTSATGEGFLAVVNYPPVVEELGRSEKADLPDEARDLDPTGVLNDKFTIVGPYVFDYLSRDIGNAGEMYIDTQNHLIYGPKTANGWGDPINADVSLAQQISTLQAQVNTLSLGELVAPGGAIYKLVVDDDGNLSTELQA